MHTGSSEMEEPESGLTPAIRKRVMAQIPIFSEALEAVSTKPTPKALDDLQEAADSLMRAVGRVLIETERLRGVHQTNG